MNNLPEHICLIIVQSAWHVKKSVQWTLKINDYTQQNKRVLSTECSLCQTCISACTQDALKMSAGFDIGGEEHLRRL